MHHLRIVFSALFFALTPSLTLASDNLGTRIRAGIHSSFDVPLRQLKTRGDGTFLERVLDGFSGGLSVGLPLDMSTQAQLSGDGFRNRIGNTPTLRATVKYNLVGNWFAAGTYYHYIDRDRQADWNPDFSYVFGYDDWRPYTFSLIYANYGGNRISPNRENGEEVTEFEEGTIQAGWKFPIEGRLARPFLVADDGAIGCLVGYNASPSYFDLAQNRNKRWKQSVSLGCKYTITGNWYLNWTAFYYPAPAQQQPWDPDFTYGFGYFDWRPGTISIQYNNYSGNRYPGRERGEGTGRFTDGEISVSWSWAF